MKTYLVTGGAGFIGSNFIRYLLTRNMECRVINLDLLTYAGNRNNLNDFESDGRYKFVQGDIKDASLLKTLFTESRPDGIIHFAAESHVDRSIRDPEVFIDTNIKGTFRLLEAALDYWRSAGNPDNFRFLHVSTDEVYGSLGPDGAFTEITPYDPSSPYSASKAASDHFVKACSRTYGLPVLLTNCSNNYGPFQFPEKLIPLMILNIRDKKPLPVYGDGLNVRDWLYVFDHCDALMTVMEKGRPGETYNVGGGVEMSNIDLVNRLCDLVDMRLNRSESSRYLITHVEDRPGHDRRYAIDSTKIETELGWRASFSIEKALGETVDWYLANTVWTDSVKSGEYRKWISDNYGDRK